MFLNNKLPKGLIELYKNQEKYQKEQEKYNIQQTQQVQPQVVSTQNQEENKQEVQKRPLIHEKLEYLKQEQKRSEKTQNKNQQNPFVKYHKQNGLSDEENEEDSQEICENSHQKQFNNKGFFEFIEPKVKAHSNLQEGLQDSFIYMIIGPPKSGKTLLLHNLITNPKFYGQKNSAKTQNSQFDKIIFVSPSILPGFKLRENYNYIRKVDLFMIYNLLNAMDLEYQRTEQFQQTHIKGNLLLIFDDCIGDMLSLQKKREFQNIFNNRRQILISLDIQIIATSQTSNGLPAFIRKISTGIFIFQVLGNIEHKILVDENIPKRYKESFKSILSEYLKDKFQYIYISKYPFEIYQGQSPDMYNRIQLL